jgi:hypothetical protein
MLTRDDWFESAGHDRQEATMWEKPALTLVGWFGRGE